MKLEGLLLFLDLTEEAVMLYDKSSFLESMLLDLKRRLLNQGTRRVMVGKERWYWVLKPGYKYGEKLSLLKIAKSYLRQA